MALIEIFFTQTVTIRPYVRMLAGEPLYGDPEIRKCRLEHSKIRKTFSGNEGGSVFQDPAGAKMYCVGDPIPIGSIVECGDRDYVVSKCIVMYGFSADHLEVTLQ